MGAHERPSAGDVPTEVGAGDDGLSGEPSRSPASAHGAARLLPGSVVGRYVILPRVTLRRVGPGGSVHQPHRGRRAGGHAASILEAELGLEHPHLAHPLLGLAELALTQRRYADALTLAERALRLREQDGVPPEERAEARAIVAMAMFESGGDRKRAWSLAREALEDFRAAAPAKAEERTELEAWMATHGDGTANP